ncbi:MAG: ABC transporter permease, partial [Candidatus Acidiferrales bacterium]
AGCLAAEYLLEGILVFAPQGIPRLAAIELNGYSLLFACASCILIALAFGIAPALLMNRRDLQNSLNLGNARLTGHPRGAFFRKSLIAAEITVTAVLLASAGMVIHNFYNLQRVELGFLPDHALTAQIRLSGYDQPRSKAFFIQLLERLQSRPEVTAAGAILLRPFEGTVGWDVAYQTRGQDSLQASGNPISNFEVVTPDYFRAVGTPLLAGRWFTLDDKDSNQNVMIVSRSLARDLFGNFSGAIGKQVALGRSQPDENTAWWTVVGVVADAQYRKLGVTQRDIFIPFLQTNIPLRYLVVRTKTSPEAFLPALRQELAAIDSRQAVSKVRTLEQLIAGAKTGPRFAMLLFLVFGVFAALLSAVGVYGLVSDSIVQRRREAGIRMALGAQPRQVLFLLMQGEMRAVLLGEFFGLLFSLGLFRIYAPLLYGLEGMDYLSAAATIVILTSVTLAASTFPALRATELPLTHLLAD